MGNPRSLVSPVRTSRICSVNIVLPFLSFFLLLLSPDDEFGTIHISPLTILGFDTNESSLVNVLEIGKYGTGELGEAFTLEPHSYRVEFDSHKYQRVAHHTSG